MKYLNTLYRRIDRFINDYLLQSLLTAFALLALIVVLWPYVVKVVPAGSAGVLYRPLFGGVNLNSVYYEGVHFIFPWDTLTQYNARIQTKTVEIDVLTKDLLKTKVTVAYQYEINAMTLPLLHKYVGQNYLETIIEPFIISSTREKVAQFDSSMAFTADMRKIINDIAITANTVLVEKVNPPGIEFVKLVRIPAAEISDIKFPELFQQSIEEKLVQQSKAEAYQYILAAAKQEALRKEIEAEGIRKFQDIVRPGLSEGYLRWKGIEATQKLAESNNAKIVMFGSGSSGLPLILGDADKSGTLGNKAK
jgi:regulator of protease activity HflC (stomatin/prohibitin superfamily)